MMEGNTVLKVRIYSTETLFFSRGSLRNEGRNFLPSHFLLRDSSSAASLLANAAISLLVA